jgi:hypothetical protein
MWQSHHPVKPRIFSRIGVELAGDVEVPVVVRRREVFVALETVVVNGVHSNRLTACAAATHARRPRPSTRHTRAVPQAATTTNSTAASVSTTTTTAKTCGVKAVLQRRRRRCR